MKFLKNLKAKFCQLFHEEMLERWEYKHEIRGFNPHQSIAMPEAQLNDLGVQGWNLIAILSPKDKDDRVHYIFKRISGIGSTNFIESDEEMIERGQYVE
jgi:hypothetical protein